jgi:hypothetical protein
MVVFGPFEFEQGWIALSIVLYIAVAALGIAGFGPATRRALDEARADPTSAAYQTAARRANLLGGLATLIAVVIVGLMVLKPF